ncbi:D-alanine--D-alanine ligase (plasmid) [Burkholderia sp. AD24]|nr:D-alanine--D-alanine ligase [Burkholderia sp. AD24]
MKRFKIAVLCGGNSEERMVSLASAAMTVPVLRSMGHTVQVVDLGYGLLSEADEKERLASPDTWQSMGEGIALPDKASSITSFFSGNAAAFDLVFMALHGGTGEDGTIQAALDLMKIPYTGSGHAASALCMDKDLTKRLLRFAGICTPDWTLLKRDSDFSVRDFDYPVVVKPNRQGSTVGLSIVLDAAKLNAAVEHAFRFDTEVLVEQFIAGREFTVGILDGRPLTVGEIHIDADSVFGYEQKYRPGAVVEQFPAEIAPTLAAEIRDAGLEAHRVLKLDDYSRADFRLDSAGRLWLLEVNSLPGLTRTSLLPQSAQASGIHFPKLCESLCQLAMRRTAGTRRETA